ncbi:MAG TPA: TolC family protein [Bacteroidales bacterium]|nr:TolC family protein [Bacteroidales bacterium]
MKTIRIAAAAVLSIIIPSALMAQAALPADSVSLNAALRQVIENYPAIEKSVQESKAADARVGLAKTSYYPDISINSTYSRIGPVSSFTLPGYGTFSLYPENNFSATINYNQVIYDFGKTAKGVNYEKQNRELVNTSSVALRQKISLSVVNVYYSIVFLQEAIRIKNEQISTLNEHLTYVEKKQETGSATKYDILTTQVKISSLESQKTDLQTVLKTVVCQMNSLLGTTESNTLVLKRDLQPFAPVPATDSLLSLASALRPEMKLAAQRTELAELRYKVINNQNNPSINLFSAVGFKNGYTPDIDKEKANYAVGLGLKVPVYDAGRKKNNLIQAKADIECSKQDEELTRRAVVNEVIENQANLEAAIQKIAQTELQLQQAKQAYALAEVSFKSGVITNLELLDSSTSLSEARLAVLKARIDYSQSLMKLKIATGEQIY